ncbi:MAG: hypothetical protein ACTMUB_08150 [cyanobacterium endosymbiont of Rhopalodia musculus]|uniref:hypothetical protein n=1 Tax=cyanobacterium endosymbiont of Epithemia clementina EcSB TaxID=3034674 RepID=UPI002480250F|nr:hypothetical protein [cyanobacterium endosymbiont of Epithemia clementina EcSB]WGT68053.1 hypothetical protein P3F56_02945 [cyanobacterium endosymbiont of Epithemia clementina EcSB]
MIVNSVAALKFPIALAIVFNYLLSEILGDHYLIQYLEVTLESQLESIITSL